MIKFKKHLTIKIICIFIAAIFLLSDAYGMDLSYRSNLRKPFSMDDTDDSKRVKTALIVVQEKAQSSESGKLSRREFIAGIALSIPGMQYLFDMESPAFLDTTGHSQVRSVVQGQEDATIQPIKLRGNQLIVNNKPYQIRGVTLSTLAPEQDRQAYVLDLNSVGEDLIAKLKSLGANTVRTYVPPHDDLLNELDRNGIRVIVGFSYKDDNNNSYSDKNGELYKPDIITGGYLTYIEEHKNHPAILMWELGNEPDYMFREHPDWIIPASELRGKSDKRKQAQALEKWFEVLKEGR